ncbi:hypothetical protein [Geobacter sp.]|uniref:hypothetical protein n=1 Tax=Geobacter sp. TaxID=46610 RepID=UPI00261C1C84|nr:hypothetical protein [Geobacter sp.]
MTEIAGILAAAEERYRLLLAEAEALLRNFDTATPEDFDEMMTRRQTLVDEIQKIDGQLAGVQGEKGTSCADHADPLGRFRRLQEEATRQIIEIDALVIALARERLGRLQENMGALVRGKTALHGYERSGRERRHGFNDTV